MYGKYLLSIDGGGIRGIIPLYFLLCLEKDLLIKHNKTVYETFDMYAGTSVGSIVIGSIVYTNFGSVQKLIDNLYTTENLKGIFSPYPNILRHVMLRPLYSGSFKTNLIKKYLKDTKITDTEKKVLIPVYSVSEQKAKFYKSYTINAEGDVKDDNSENYNINNKKLLLSSVVDASSAAPIYFPSVEYDSDTEDIEIDTKKQKKQKKVIRVGIDGAVFSNNPSDCLYADALRLYPEENITIISIGTGSKMQTKRHSETKKWGSFQWVRSGLVDTLISNEIISDYKTKHFAEALGHRYIRIQEPVNISLDDITKISELKEIAFEWYNKYRDELLKLF